MKEVDKDRINDFWDWFENNLHIIEDVILGRQTEKRNEIIDGFDDHILGFGKLKWILDEPQTDQFQLVISPNGDTDLWKITRSIISQAPDLGHWTFNDALPANGQLKIEIYNDYMNVQSIDANNWELFLSPEMNDQLRVYLSDIYLSEYLDIETFQIGAKIILTNLIGEGAMIDRISGVEIIAPSTKEELLTKIPIQDLNKHLKSTI